MTAPDRPRDPHACGCCGRPGWYGECGRCADGECPRCANTQYGTDTTEQPKEAA